MPLRRLRAEDGIVLRKGTNALSYAVESWFGGIAPRAEVTLFAIGEKRPALVDPKTLTDARRVLLNRESVMPVLYFPEGGFDAFPAIAVRPGERAEPVFTVRGPIGRFSLSIGDESRSFDAVPEGESFTTPRGTFRPIAGIAPIRLERLDGDEAKAVFFFTKLY